MEKKDSNKVCFGRGFRRFTPTREVSTFPPTIVTGKQIGRAHV